MDSREPGSAVETVAHSESSIEEATSAQQENVTQQSGQPGALSYLASGGEGHQLEAPVTRAAAMGREVSEARAVAKRASPYDRSSLHMGDGHEVPHR